ncbi:hypothetical protein N0V85_008793 [Neurospora sp. IMI 360204]|nr:hypothetical protein N0V85_008793 [Neurospora sp. IMI 360204]
MVFGYLFISYVVIPGWKEVVKEAEKIEAKMRGTTSEAQFDQCLVQVPMSLIRLDERSAVDMSPTEPAEVYHVTNKIVVPQFTGTAVLRGIDANDLVRFEPVKGMKAASRFVLEEEDTFKDTTTASDDSGDKVNKRDLKNDRILRRRFRVVEPVKGMKAASRFVVEEEDTFKDTTTASDDSGDKVNKRDPKNDRVLRRRGARPASRYISPDAPSESSNPKPEPAHDQDHELKPHDTNGWGHDFHNKVKEAATHDVVEATKAITEEKTHTGLPLVLLSPGGVEDDKVKRDQLAHDPVPATKSKPEQKKKDTEEPKKHYHRRDLEVKKKKSPRVQAVEDGVDRFGQKDENFKKQPDDKKHEDKRNWLNSPQNPKPKVGADPTPREPQTVNLGEDYGTEGLHKVQGTVHLPDGRTYYTYGDHYKPRRSAYGYPTGIQSRAWGTIYPDEGDRFRVARHASGAAPTAPAGHQYYGAGAAPVSYSTHAALASMSRPMTQGYAPAKDTRASSASASAYATSTAVSRHDERSHAENYDGESLKQAGALSPAANHPAASHPAPHQYNWYSPYERPDGKPDVPNPTHGRPDVPTHDDGKRHKKDEGKGREDNGKGKGKAREGSFHSQITANTDCSNNATDGSSGSGHFRRLELELPKSGGGHDQATPLHPNPKGKGWNWFRGRAGGGGVDHSSRNVKEKENETVKGSQKKVVVKAMNCGIEIIVSKASASGTSLTATASFTVKGSPKWWTAHPRLKTDISRSSSSATPTTTPTAATSKPTTTTTTSSSESNGPSHNKNEKGKRAVANNAYNDDPHRAQTVPSGILEIHLTPEEAKPELMDAKYAYWEFKAPPDLYVVSDQDSPSNPYAGAREKRKHEAEEAERKRMEQEEHLGDYGDVGEYPDERGLK